MPLIQCDYSSDIIDAAGLKALVKLVLDQSIETFHSNLDAVTVFTRAFEEADHSTAAAEIELRARIAEFDDPAKSRDEVRLEYMARYDEPLKTFLRDRNITAPIIFTITFEDWKVNVISA